MRATDPVLVLRHDTGRKVVVTATDLRWWSVDVSNVTFAASRVERKTGDLPYVRKEPDSKGCVRVTILEGFPEPEGSRGGWGEEEAREALERLKDRTRDMVDAADLAFSSSPIQPHGGMYTLARPSCTCGVPTCPVCHYQSLVRSLQAEAADRQDTLDQCRQEYARAQAEGRDGWSEAVRANEGLLANTLNRLKWAERDLREAREERS